MFSEGQDSRGGETLPSLSLKCDLTLKCNSKKNTVSKFSCLNAKESNFFHENDLPDPIVS